MIYILVTIGIVIIALAGWLPEAERRHREVSQLEAYIKRLEKQSKESEQEITNRRDVYNGVRNQTLLNDLKRDTKRILPLVEARPARAAAPVVVPATPTNGTGAPPPLPGVARSGEHAAAKVTD